MSKKHHASQAYMAAGIEPRVLKNKVCPLNVRLRLRQKHMDSSTAISAPELGPKGMEVGGAVPYKVGSTRALPPPRVAGIVADWAAARGLAASPS